MTNGDTTALDRDRWGRLWQRIAPVRSEKSVFESLARFYAEPARRYHNAHHIVVCLRLFDEVKELVVDPLSLELAIWFHDAIYDPRASDNEERSAQLAADAITQAGGAVDLASRVGALVLATKSHDPGFAADAPWLLDIDLAIFGQPIEAFDAYEAAIRAEYAWVDPAEFCARRAQVLASFLGRPRIYLTSVFHEQFEARARANLERSISRLRCAQI